MQHRILAIDNDTLILESLEKVLKLEGYMIDCLSNPLKVAEKIKTNSYHCILLDIKMPGMNGLEVLNIILKESQTTPVIMISGQSNIDIAVKSIKEGAYDFIEKPIVPERLLISIEHAIQKHQLMHHNQTITHELEKSYQMIGVSQAIAKIHKDIRIIAPTTAKVLISGDTGTGKELVAKAIHYQSNRSDQPYLKINCAAIPPDLLESQLFGHKRGAFSGAIQDHHGFFIQANGGTLFLDEIGDMNLTLQSKLLRVLQENEVDLIGDPHPVKIDVRIISATNKNLLELIQKGQFREAFSTGLKLLKFQFRH